MRALISVAAACMLFGCSRSSSKPAPSTEAIPSASEGEARAPARLTLSELTFLMDGEAPFIVLHADGLLRVSDREWGRLVPDGTFSFSEGGGLVSARLTEEGRVLVFAREGTDLAKLPGALGKLFREYGQNEIASAYTIRGDGTAIAPRGAPLFFDDHGRLSEKGLVVRGLSAETRRTALFVYLIVATVL